MKKIFLTAVAVFSAVSLFAQQPGGLSSEMLEQISASYEDNAYAFWWYLPLDGWF